MDVLTHFRTIEELTKTLSREQGLLSEMFEKRKLMKFPQGLALELVGGNEARLRKLLDYGVLVETGNTLEIESDYLNFFEEVLNVNEEISVLSVQECINTLKEHIGYFLQETNTNRKAGYQDRVRQLLKKTGFRTLKNVVDLKRNMDNAYKQEPNYLIKKKKLQNLDEKSHSIRSMIRECEKLMDNEHAFFLMANDPHMSKTCSDVKHDFVEAYHALMEIDRQIIVYINQIEQQNLLYKKIRKLKYLQDQLLIKTDTNLVQVLEDSNPLWMESRQYSKIRLSLEMLRENDQTVSILKRIAERNGLDGNVHFTGTHGVGKSTVLRALLFFYNADKHRLGIQQAQKSFDEFYFRQSNSYILYEVMRDNGAYTILVSRYQGRASWRFIDASYQREWLIDEDKHVLSDWVKIRERIDKNVSVSARIDSGVMFKDIIFGNTHDSKYTRYALVQSAHYQNIPRSIQNVFLNTKLDADFVKNTIIQSMADEDLPIDLQTYRRLVTDFEREYDEIDCWFRQTRDGNYPVRQQALKIAEQGRRIVALNQQLLDVWRMLNHAVAESEQKIPLLETEAAEVKTGIEKERSREKELTAEYDKERDALNQELGSKKGKLKEIAQARKDFEALGIEEKLALAAREESIRQETTNKQILLDDLLKTHASIEEKYNIARGKLENARQAFENTQKEAYYQKQGQLEKERKRLEDERTKNRNEVMDAFNNWRHESDERLELLQKEQNRADNAVKELRLWHPKADEMNQIKEQLRQLEVTERENTAQQTAVRSQIAQVTTEYEMKETELKQPSQREQERLEESRTRYREQIAKIEEVLSRLDGSLYQWLTVNVEGWEDTIGKVVDEERILYAEGLEPQLGTKESDSLFGIKLNLDNIDAAHRTPDDYREEKKRFEEQLQQTNRQLMQLPITLQDDISKLGKKYAVQLNPLRQQATLLKVEEEQIPVKRQNLQNQQHKLEMEEQELIAQEREIRERASKEALLKVQAEKDAREAKETKNKKELKDLDTAFNKSSKVLYEELQLFKESQAQEAIARNQEFAAQKAQLDEQQKAELAGKGVDVTLLNQYRKALDALKELLKQIDTECPTVIRYRDAEQNLFAKEPEIKKSIKDIEQQLAMMRQRYEDKHTRIEKKRQEMEERQKAILKDLSHRREGLNQYHQMVDNEHLVPDTFLSDDKATESHQDCQQLISQLRGTVNQKRETMEKLKDTVVNFNRNFKPQNAFHFNTMPVTDNDYLQIAVDLQDFMDNNKIEEFRRRTSEHYKDILGRISTEIGALMKRRSDVDSVILDINRDFVEKNFAGVIKSIELRANESSDRLMQLLMSIHDYTVDNALSIGELNLFSSDNRDEVNRKVVDYLKSLSHQLQDEQNRPTVSLGDAFRLQFRVKENDNDTNWVERINNVGSDGTDILVKAMVNIMLINVFKKKAARKSGDFIIHCMMDEIGRLHPNNIKGILQFANSRNIYLINSSPTSYNPYDYKYTYLLSKHGVKTRVDKLLKRTN